MDEAFLEGEFLCHTGFNKKNKRNTVSLSKMKEQEGKDSFFKNTITRSRRQRRLKMTPAKRALRMDRGASLRRSLCSRPPGRRFGASSELEPLNEPILWLVSLAHKIRGRRDPYSGGFLTAIALLSSSRTAVRSKLRTRAPKRANTLARFSRS